MTPTATMDAPTTTDQPTMDAAIDDLVQTMTGAEESAAPAGEQTPGGEAPAPEPGAPAPGPETPGGEAPTYQLTEDGKAYVVPKEELAGLTAMREYTAKVQDRFPTVADAEAAYKSSDIANRIYRDLASGGDDAGVANLLDYLTGGGVHQDFPQVKAQFQNTFIKLADKIPDALQSLNADAHYSFVDRLIAKEIQQAYQAAAKSGDPAQLKAAQWLDYGWNGKYQTELPKVEAPPANQALTQREQELAQRENRLLQDNWTQFNTASVEGAKWKDFNAEVDRTLEPIKSHYEAETWPYIRSGIVKDLTAKMSEDRIWADSHAGQFGFIQKSHEQLWRKGQSPESLKQLTQAYVNDFMLRARKYLPSVAKALLAKAPGKTAAPRVPPPAQPTVARAPNGQFKTVEEKEDAYQQAVNAAADAVGW